jgi:hypothetical protein
MQSLTLTPRVQELGRERLRVVNWHSDGFGELIESTPARA